MSKKSIALVTIVFPFAVAAPVMAGAHTWKVVELFSNGDGTIQYVEIQECCGLPNEIGIGAGWIRSNANGNQYNFPGNLPAGTTANAHILLATAAFAALPGAPTPDHIIPANFFNTSAEPFPGVEYYVYNDFIFSAGMLPLNDKDSLNHPVGGGAYTVGANSPTNFHGVSGNVDACPWDLDGDGVVGIVDFLDLLGNWNNPYTIIDFLDLLATWGPC